MVARTKRLVLRFALVMTLAFVTVPSMGDQKVSLFNPFSLESITVVAADSTPSVQLADLLLLAEGTAPSTLGDDGQRPTVSLRGVEIRIPQRANLRSSFSKTPFAASIW